MALLRLQRPAAAPQAAPVTGTLVGFYPDKGYGFITPDGGGKDLMIRRDVLMASGVLEVPPAGSRIQCLVEDTPRGPYAKTVLMVTANAHYAPPGIRGPEVMKVKFFDAMKGYGFVIRQDGVNVHLPGKVVKDSGIDALRSEETLEVWYAPGKTGFVATKVRVT